MELIRRGIFRAVGLVNDHRSKRSVKKISNGALMEYAKRQGLIYEQTKEKTSGVIRIRMVVKKSDLEKLMHVGDDGYDDVSLPSLVEQRLKQLRRKHHSKASGKGISWTPALRSIPEDF